MSAETLGRAALLMRVRAKAAAKVPGWADSWSCWDIDRDGTCDGCAEEKHLIMAYSGPDAEPWLCSECAAYSAHVDALTPTVALAAADLLEALARAVERSGVAHHPEPASITERGLTFANAYLATSAVTP